jgi:hypothetical protein
LNQSAELKALVLRAYDAMAHGDAQFYDRHLARDAGVLIIGTDPNEWWADHDTISRVFKAQMQEVQGLGVVAGDPIAYSVGDAGWVADQPAFRLPDGTLVPFRMTVVFVREDGAWKIAHQHISIGVPNEDIVGRDVTVA